MNQQETTGALANGGSYRATSYLVELRDAGGSEIETIDASTIKAIQRNGQRVTIRRAKGKDVSIDAASLDDAGRLEIAVRGATTPTGQPVVAKKGGFGRFATIGCGGLLGLVVLIVIIVAASSSSGDDRKGATSSGATAQPGTNKGDVHVPLAAGSTGEIAAEGNANKKSRVTIVAINDNARSTNQFSQPPAGKKYYAVQVTVENAGTAEVSSLDWKLRDSKDNELDDKIAVAGLGEMLDPVYTLTPGGKKSGLIVFEIDADAAPKWLRADPNPFLKNDLYFDAP